MNDKTTKEGMRLKMTLFHLLSSGGGLLRSVLVTNLETLYLARIYLKRINILKRFPHYSFVVILRV